MISAKPLKDVTAADIEALVDGKVREDRHLDYKEQLPTLTKQSDKKHFLADVSAFANSAGGDLIFGIREDGSGVPDQILGLGPSNLDQEIQRLTNVIDTGLDPALLPKTEALPVDTRDGLVLILRVPKSFTAPHMVKNSWKFYARHTLKNVPMDAATLRASFTMSEGWPERVTRFRQRRIAQVLSDETPHQLTGSEKLVLHLVPFSAFVPESKVDVRAIRSLSVMPLITDGGLTTKFNLDGVCIASVPGYSYVQFFRDGCVEAVVLEGNLNLGDRIWLPRIEDDVLKGVADYARIIVGEGVALPISIGISLVGVAGRRAFISEHHGDVTLDRDVVTLPDLVLDAPPADLADLKVALRPLFDMLWQACGSERSRSYDEQGAWVRQRR